MERLLSSGGEGKTLTWSWSAKLRLQCCRWVVDPQQYLLPIVHKDTFDFNGKGRVPAPSLCLVCILLHICFASCYLALIFIIQIWLIRPFEAVRSKRLVTANPRASRERRGCRNCGIAFRSCPFTFKGKPGVVSPPSSMFDFPVTLPPASGWGLGTKGTKKAAVEEKTAKRGELRLFSSQRASP